MSGDIERRPLQGDERAELHRALDELAWTFARKLEGLGPDDAPVNIWDKSPNDDQIKAVRLTRIAVYKTLATLLDASIYNDVQTALEHGAESGEISSALGITRQAVTKRFGQARFGDNVAVVISRRDRVREHADDPRGRVGEVGGTAQYGSDRGIWPIGKKVRAEAKYAIVAVDGTVRRVYALAPGPDAWSDPEPNKWQFTAIEDREMNTEEIDAAYEAGELPLRPGDDCPTRAGGAYRPHWF